MTKQELQALTVLQLRKVAKENGVKLCAGISKEGIVERIFAAVGDKEETPAAPVAETVRTVVEEPVLRPAAQPAAQPVMQPENQSAGVPVFRSAWSNPNQNGAQRYNSRPAWQNNNMNQQRPAPRYGTRPMQERPQFGPGAATQQPMRSAGVTRFGPQAVTPQPRYDEQPRRGFGPQEPASPAPHMPDAYAAPLPAYENNQQENGIAPAAADLMAAVNCPEVNGILELHPDGYGFLRGETFLPSSKDIYISIAQIRRFGLRSGDRIIGRARPQRDSDKYAAMLCITSVNGEDPDNIAGRVSFEELTAAYSSRRIDLDCHDGEKLDDMRLVDLIAPLGFGQRALILAQPGSGKTQLMQHFAGVIHTNYPDVKILAMLLNQTPEDAALFREAVGSCPVAASTFDQPPENHMRMCELLLERCMRYVECGEQVVLLVDSLTQMAKTFSNSMQQLRTTPGLVNPTSLSKAKRLFASARATKQGGSLTVIAAMDVDTDNPVDSALVGEFRANANMILQLDAAMAEVGVTPAFELSGCSTKNAEMLLNAEELEGMRLTRKILGSTPSVKAVPQLLDMMHTVDSNATFLRRIKEWAALLDASN